MPGSPGQDRIRSPDRVGRARASPGDQERRRARRVRAPLPPDVRDQDAPSHYRVTRSPGTPHTRLTPLCRRPVHGVAQISATIMKDPVRAGSSLVQPRSNSPARTPAVNASHSGAAKTRFGPAVPLESRTAIRSLVSAISTHAPLALLWLLLRQWARDRSGMFIPHPLSSRPRDRSQQRDAFVGPEGGCAEVLEHEDIPAYLHVVFEEQVAGHAVDVDQALIRWVGELDRKST